MEFKVNWREYELTVGDQFDTDGELNFTIHNTVNPGDSRVDIWVDADDARALVKHLCGAFDASGWVPPDMTPLAKTEAKPRWMSQENAVRLGLLRLAAVELTNTGQQGFSLEDAIRVAKYLETGA